MDPGLQIAQALHASREFRDIYPQIDELWYKHSNYVAILQVADLTALKSLMYRLQENGIKFVSFREPDLDNELTALCVEPGTKSRKLLSSLPLALKQYKNR